MTSKVVRIREDAMQIALGYAPDISTAILIMQTKIDELRRKNPNPAMLTEIKTLIETLHTEISEDPTSLEELRKDLADQKTLIENLRKSIPDEKTLKKHITGAIDDALSTASWR